MRNTLVMSAGGLLRSVALRLPAVRKRGRDRGHLVLGVIPVGPVTVRRGEERPGEKLSSRRL